MVNPCRIILLILGMAAASAPLFAQLVFTDTAIGANDLQGDQSVRTLIGTLAVGTNTVQGTLLFSDGHAQGDTFTVVLPAGTVMLGNTLTITNSNMDAGAKFQERVYKIPSPIYSLMGNLNGNGSFGVGLSNFTNGGPQ